MFQPYNNMYVPNVQQMQYRTNQMEQMYPQYNNVAQNYNAQQQVSYLNGKIVDSIEVVKASDIPMDGNYYYFPKADGTEIYAKKWLANGTTEVLTYKPYIEPMQDVNNVAVVPNNEVYDVIVEKLDSINERIEKIEKLVIPKNNNNARGTSKKEVGES